MLAERSSQMTINMHDIDNKRASITKLESDLRTEKVLMINDLRVNRRDPFSPPPPPPHSPSQAGLHGTKL